jgi:hypothetical protein
LFLAEASAWAQLSRDALAFLSVNEAMRFAALANLDRAVRPVIRVLREKHYVLMPLLDMPDPVEGARLKSGLQQSRFPQAETIRR